MKGRGKWARIMRKDWDDRARRDVFHYTTWRPGHKWNEGTFFESGERDYVLWVEPVLQSVELETTDSNVLDLGCGIGRMTRSLARRFSHVYAVDVSPEMISRAKAFNKDLSNVTWHLVDGFDLAFIQDRQIDFAFSFLVFQHVPHREIVMRNIEEMLRVLRPGGFFLFQYNGESTQTMDWSGRLIWGILDRWRIPLLPRLLKLDVREAGKTWAGAILNPQEVVEHIESHGGTLLGSRGVGTPGAWCWGVRQ